MNDVCLVRPSMQLQDNYFSFYQDWVSSGEYMVPWVISRDPSDFPSMLEFLLDNERGANLPDGWVPSSTFWLVDATNRVIGAVNIRHRLTEYLRTIGGHIGYGIRPSERRKGYATKLLQLSLIRARDLGIQRALLTCDEKNVASEKTIRNNGGIQDSNYIDDNGHVTCRFWIDTRG
ncbi:GNAT family N-acetyltransferase [Alicyclobacillus sp. SO9]|uniref:GNAT family N-acetyltransferase n=1 Tax=Alicyclobacillus sp. SO9 TaxID=2665646 RepID=UPI0018E75D1C|nr:GNAT family N-acetyltransferase [Alicyclobacillus sp. SO9]QQE77837.1 GNAT family N-acetyltransferase [Alicyclobacillus sp. SO9]